jgi:hypothetical protein
MTDHASPLTAPPLAAPLSSPLPSPDEILANPAQRFNPMKTLNSQCPYCSGYHEEANKCPESLKCESSAPSASSPLDLERLLKAVPPDVLKKISLHDLHRIAENYNASRPPADHQSKVFTRLECIFHYCPHPSLCDEVCQCPNKSEL